MGTQLFFVLFFPSLNPRTLAQLQRGWSVHGRGRSVSPQAPRVREADWGPGWKSGSSLQAGPCPDSRACVGVSVGMRGWGWGSPQMGLQSVLHCLALASDRSKTQVLERKNHQMTARIQRWKVGGARGCRGLGELGPTLGQGPPEALPDDPRVFPKPETRDLVQKSKQPGLCHRH